MDEMTPQSTIQPSRPFYKQKAFWIIFVALIIIAGGVVYYFHHKKPVILTPQQTLDQLQNSSEPVTATPQQRAADLSAAEKSSKPYVVSQQKQLNILNMLAK